MSNECYDYYQNDNDIVLFPVVLCSGFAFVAATRLKEVLLDTLSVTIIVYFTRKLCVSAWKDIAADGQHPIDQKQTRMPH